MKLLCECLNVKVHVRGTELLPIDTTLLDLNEMCLEEEFFNLKLSQVQLDLEGVAMEHKYLVNQQRISSWVIYKCENCSTFTHAIRLSAAGNGRVLVNCELLKAGSSTERLEKSPDYSKLFRVVLRGRRNDNHPIRTQGLDGAQYESLQSALADIQHKLNHYLIEEENAMEERIRCYEEQQRAEYAELQSKARQEKNDLISLVLAAAAESDGFSSQTSPPRSPGERQRDNSTSSENGNRRLAGGEPITSKKNKTLFSKAPQLVVDSGMDDPLFGVDGFDDISDPFYESDDGENTEDDSLSEDLLSSAESGVYSTSVPISVPQWNAPRRRTSHRNDEEEQRKKTPPLENMAASMQALARSVHGDGTEIFGDRPRPRLNTLDMSKLRR